MTKFKGADFLSGDVVVTDVQRLKKKELILVAKGSVKSCSLQGKQKLMPKLWCYKHWQSIIC